MAKDNRSGRNGSVDFWKFVCAVAIMLFHSHLFAPNPGAIPFVSGALSVEFFFITSGFLMAKSCSRIEYIEGKLGTQTRDFVFHKIKRLCPEFPIAWIIAFIVKSWGTKEGVFDNLMIGIFDISFLRMSGIPSFRANQAAWYISAMLLSMAMLVPLLIKHRDMFLNVIAPLLAAFLLGLLWMKGGSLGALRRPTAWMGLCYRGMVRSISELCLGSVLFNIYDRTKNVEFTKTGSILIQLVEWFAYGYALVWMFSMDYSKMDYVVLFMFAVGVLFSFLGKGIASHIFNNDIIYWLGGFSLPLFLAQHSWALRLNSFFPGLRYRNHLIIYLALTITTALFIHFASVFIRKHWDSICKKAKHILIAQNN